MKFKTTIDQSICNSLRRIMISEIPTYSIDIVSIENNNGIMHDEMLSHRLGLIPLVVIKNDQDLDKLINDDLIFFTLEIMGEKSVFSSDLKTDQEFIKLVNDDILLTKLDKGQYIKLKAIVKKGIGKTHSKWSPACGVSYADNQDSITFHLETLGSITPKEMFLTSIDILNSKLDLLQELLK